MGVPFHKGCLGQRVGSKYSSGLKPGFLGPSKHEEGSQLGGSSAAAPWHQQLHIVSTVLAALPDTADVLQAELVCRVWREAKTLLPSQVVIRSCSTRKQQAQQVSWLAANHGRTRHMVYEEEQKQEQQLCVKTNNRSVHLLRRKPLLLPAFAAAALSALRKQHARWHGETVCPQQHTETVVGFMSRAKSANTLCFRSCPSLLELPSNLCLLQQQLHSLTISCCSNLQELPQDLGCLSSLEHLALLHCENLSKLPYSIGGLSQLQQLTVKGCPQLQALPKSLLKLTSLKSLEIESCGLKALPAAFPGPRLAASLTSLSISDCCGIQELPDGLFTTAGPALTALQRLTLQLPSLEMLPPGMGARLPRLVKFTVGGQALGELPASLGSLIELTHLVIRGCHALSALPACLAHLVSLRRLDVTSCKNLHELPENFGASSLRSSLTCLVLSDCASLRELPPSVGALGGLRQLVLHNCASLRHLPSSMGGEEAGLGGSLQSLTISGCEALHGLPVSLLRLKQKITPGAAAEAAAAQAVAGWADA
uniref:F-box domain-containing protein n=1 Tax=Tetradesmus obliquus TaxID=3088 RepID=A0A383WL19_TETOB|eukprot:jgi/Sobl393_1/12038/SZX71253.1